MTLKYEVYRLIGRIESSLSYIRHGEYHRIGGPATVWVDGDISWMVYGTLHKLDGPAEIYNGKAYHFIRGEYYTTEEYDTKIRNTIVY